MYSKYTKIIDNQFIFIKDIFVKFKKKFINLAMNKLAIKADNQITKLYKIFVLQKSIVIKKIN